VSGLDVAPQTAVTPQDATIQVGNPATGGYTVSSDSNTFANLMPGVTLTASKIQSGVTVNVTSDADAIAAKMQAMVDAANAGLAEFDRQGGIVVGAKTQAPLAGEYAVRELSQQTLSTVASGSATYGSYKSLGIELTRDGKLTFDKTAFLAAYAADPAKAQKGATELGDAVKAVADKGQKNITGTITNHTNAIRDLNDQIGDWDVRLATRQEALQRQYANLEVALGKLKDQSSWLSGQIASLPTGG
jgi:flagellar hook-associated protein 2